MSENEARTEAEAPETDLAAIGQEAGVEKEQAQNNDESEPQTADVEIETQETAERPTEDPVKEKAAESTTSETVEESIPVPVAPKKKKKSVGFAPPPEEDLKEHHKHLREKEQDEIKSNPFHKIPPELAYLQKRKNPDPKPILDPHEPVIKPKKYDAPPLGDLRFQTVKDISVQNKQTELNFNYPEIDLFIPGHKIVVDTKYGSLNSFDLAKVNKYLYNISNVKVGLGYEFSGIISRVGTNFKDSSEFKVGAKVFGLVNPTDRKGALSTSLLLNPATDVVIVVDETLLSKLDEIDVQISVEENADFNIEEELEDAPGAVEQEVTGLRSRVAKFQVESKIPSLAKLTTFPVLYSRAKQALGYVEPQINKTGKLNLLINGGDTNLGITLLQLLFSSMYSKLEELNLILIIKEKNSDYMNKLIKKYYDPSKSKIIQLITFDMMNDDIVLPGEAIPVNYKKLDFFASEVFGALFEPGSQKINTKNINEYKLDSIVDIIGSKTFLQRTSTRVSKLDEIHLPFKDKLDNKLTELFKGSVKEPLLLKILKPKAQNSSFISMCRLLTPEPSYNVDVLFNYKSNEGVLNPWSVKWSSNLANYWARYNYYEELELRTKRQWILEGLDLLVSKELKFRIDEYTDWRNNFKDYIKLLKKDDGKVIFKIEDF